jgi:hypothetical protein
MARAGSTSDIDALVRSREGNNEAKKICLVANWWHRLSYRASISLSAAALGPHRSSLSVSAAVLPFRPTGDRSPKAGLSIRVPAVLPIRVFANTATPWRRPFSHCPSHPITWASGRALVDIHFALACFGDAMTSSPTGPLTPDSVLACFGGGSRVELQLVANSATWYPIAFHASRERSHRWIRQLEYIFIDV